MAVTPRLELRQSQSLVMTPQLQQAIKLLQLSNLEVTAFVDREVEQNPLLERVDTYNETNEPGADWPAGADAWAPSGASSGEAGAGVEQRLSREPSLRERLLEQLHMDLDDPTDRIIGLHLIDQLDEAGYLSGDFTALADLLGCGTDRIEATLACLQRFEPSGIFARDLKECLALQLAERDRLDPAMAALLANLELLARGDRARLRRLCGVDDEDLAEMIAEIRTLNPKPALAYDHKMAQPVVPDVLVRRRRQGGWLVELNNDTLPRVLVNREYYARVCADLRGQKERSYLAERYQSANWLAKALEQRAATILKVAEAIVRRQEAFLEKGVQHLRPLTLRQVADAIELHESTVSRVTANKFMSTPRGTYELKYFFTASIAGVDGGAAHSAEAVRQKIRDMIEAETPEAILSDDGIVECLRAEGIDIARRTVAKYRETLRIPSSAQRRRDKLLGR